MLISPYRLDMGMKILDKTLYKFWQDDITNFFNKKLENDSDNNTKNNFILNLASLEFSKMILRKKLKYPIINIEFKDYKNNKYKSISSYCKQARGRMINYIAINQINGIEKLKEFQGLGYKYNTKLSNDFQMIFTRGE